MKFKIYCFSSARSQHLQIFVKSPELMPIVRLIPMKVLARRISIWKDYGADITITIITTITMIMRLLKMILALCLIPTIFLAINM